MTAQVHEKIIVDGEEMSMAFCPRLPWGDPRIAGYHRRSSPEPGGIEYSTACWRGYVGTWEIKEDRFYLVGLEGRFCLLSEEPILADWFTGVLRIPRGRMLHYVHMGFGSVFEEEIHIKIEMGLVTGKRVVDNRETKPEDFGDAWWENPPSGDDHFPGDDEM